jgi:hypothetical protein
MPLEWHKLTELTGGKQFHVTSVRVVESGIVISGEFELPPLARLPYEDQVFVCEFIRSHGSIKHMEKAFGVSYPTVKGRLNRITEHLHLVEISTPAEREEVLDMLERGEITPKDAVERLKK